jgi:prevent-host-death family protein
MTQVNMHEAKSQLSRLVEKALDGEEVVIARAGKPLVRIVPLDAKPTRRLGGFVKGKLTNDFFDPLPEEELKRWGV